MWELLPGLWNMLAFGVVVVAPVVGFIWYTKLISRRNSVREALGSIDVHLKQRLDLIPNLMRMAQRYMSHESQLFSQIAMLREQAATTPDVPKRLALESEIGSLMGSFMARAEAYPALTSDRAMVEAMHSFNEVESRIAASRRFFNAAVTDLNNAVEIFPGSLIAKLAGVQAMPFFAAEEAARKSINADDYFKEAA